ncbi:hypothetical protein [Chryseobacterium sp.]|uniref:hypothetical protein n=1 Tax=Chryseobacterium sp. TaxID=1871047 RepID=UPI0028972CB4|nr:hypothetical protein [Chryseobacterium sp.]
MKKSFLATLTIFILLLSQNCNSYPMDSKNTSDMDRNTQELQKRQEAEKNKIEPNEFNNFGRPDTK